MFDKFYQTTLKDHIEDPLIHSEWIYFMSMMSNENFERDRVTMYLNILENERKKKNSQQSHNSINHRDSFELGAGDLKLGKRYSEPVKPEILKSKEK